MGSCLSPVMLRDLLLEEGHSAREVLEHPRMEVQCLCEATTPPCPSRMYRKLSTQHPKQAQVVVPCLFEACREGERGLDWIKRRNMLEKGACERVGNPALGELMKTAKVDFYVMQPGSWAVLVHASTPNTGQAEEAGRCL